VASRAGWGELVRLVLRIRHVRKVERLASPRQHGPRIQQACIMFALFRSSASPASVAHLLALGSHLVLSISTSSPASNILRPPRLFACGGERVADALHCPRIDSKLFSNDTHTGPPGAARAYLNSLRHLRSSLLRRLAPSGLEFTSEFARSIFWIS